jgi:peptidoglycan-N-acetylglucosamine deacetylase
MKSSWSQAEKLALFVFAAALLLLCTFPQFAVIPLVLFSCCCFMAPFIPGWGFFLPVISRSQTGSPGIVLSFDDGPSPETTPMILKLLADFRYNATFFVIAEKAEQYPELLYAILEAGHTVGNHSWRHDSLLMLRSSRTLYNDIHKSQQLLSHFGIRPLLFRPPAGITNPRLKSVLQKENLQTVSFSCRAFDGGNKRIDKLAERMLKKIRPGDILLLHDLPPRNGKSVSALKNECKALFTGLQERQYDVVSLETLTGEAVMEFYHSSTQQ